QNHPAVSFFSMGKKICLVCSAPNNSIHFGVEVCRACSSFFKRATLSGRQHPCRRMEQNCQITKDDKFTCRRCRYDKCIAVGMVYDGPMRRCTNTQVPKSDTCSDIPSTSTNTLLNRLERAYAVNFANRQEKELTLLRQNCEARLLPHP
ncbi:hypothetical protein PRIPAC_77039, partial [Pristionchus pacificus]